MQPQHVGVAEGLDRLGVVFAAPVLHVPLALDQVGERGVDDVRPRRVGGLVAGDDLAGLVQEARALVGQTKRGPLGQNLMYARGV